MTSRCDLLVQGKKSAGVQVCVFYQPHSEAESGPLLFAVQETTGRQNSRVHVFLRHGLITWISASYGRKQTKEAWGDWSGDTGGARSGLHGTAVLTVPAMVSAIRSPLVIGLFHPEGNVCPLSLSTNRVEDVSSH